MPRNSLQSNSSAVEPSLSQVETQNTRVSKKNQQKRGPKVPKASLSRTLINNPYACALLKQRELEQGQQHQDQEAAGNQYCFGLAPNMRFSIPLHSMTDTSQAGTHSCMRSPQVQTFPFLTQQVLPQQVAPQQAPFQQVPFQQISFQQVLREQTPSQQVLFAQAPIQHINTQQTPAYHLATDQISMNQINPQLMARFTVSQPQQLLSAPVEVQTQTLQEHNIPLSQHEAYNGSPTESLMEPYTPQQEQLLVDPVIAEIGRGMEFSFTEPVELYDRGLESPLWTADAVSC